MTPIKTKDEEIEEANRFSFSHLKEDNSVAQMSQNSNKENLHPFKVQPMENVQGTSVQEQ